MFLYQALTNSSLYQPYENEDPKIMSFSVKIPATDCNLQLGPQNKVTGKGALDLRAFKSI